MGLELCPTASPVAPQNSSGFWVSRLHTTNKKEVCFPRRPREAPLLSLAVSGSQAVPWTKPARGVRHWGRSPPCLERATLREALTIPGCPSVPCWAPPSNNPISHVGKPRQQDLGNVLSRTELTCGAAGDRDCSCDWGRRGRWESLSRQLGDSGKLRQGTQSCGLHTPEPFPCSALRMLLMPRRGNSQPQEENHFGALSPTPASGRPTWAGLTPKKLRHGRSRAYSN